jgi:PAS domain S-box-containing protein
MRSERNRLRTLLENAPIGIVLINKHGEFEYINPKFREVFGYTRDDVPNGRIWFENAYPDPEYRRKVITTWKEDLERFAVGERKPWMFEVRCKDGNVKTINFIPVGLESGEHIMTCEDVTEAILAKEIIENSEQTLKAILAASPVGIALIYRSAISWANDAAYAMTGYDPGELDGRDLGIFYPDIEEWDRVKEEFVAQKEMETQWIRKDGAIIDVLIRIAPLKNYRDSFITTVEDISVRKNAVRALERSRLELERLDRAKTKAIHHISHELKTPLAVIQGSIKLFNKKMQKVGHIYEPVRGYIETIERHLARLAGMQQESEKIFKVVREMEKTSFAADCERLWERIEAVSPVPDTIKAHWQVIHEWITGLQVESRDVESNNLFDVAKSVIRQVRQLAPARNVLIELHGKKNIEISMNPLILRDTISDLLKNAVEHTPDEGLIKVIIEKERDQAVLHVTDHGTGITPEDQKFIFDGLFHSVDTDNYTSSRPYSFGAGGKGLGLLKIKIYSQRYGFGLHMQSRRCIHLSANGYTCPGKISLCKYICDPADCIYTAGTTVTLTFEPIRESR